MMKGTVELLGMEFHSYHGCLEQERRDGNLFVVDLCAGYDFCRAAGSDSLDDAPDYSVIYDIVASEMAVPSNLIEHVAVRIARAVKDAFPELLYCRVSVSKKNPPVSGPAAWSRATVEI